MLQEITNSLNLIITQTQAHLNELGTIMAILWGIFFLDQLSGHRLLLLGIIPRHLVGLRGILFAPLLHANFNHLFFNSVPLLVLSDFLLIQAGWAYYVLVTIEITVISGFLIWCFAKPGLHVGASAVITGYWGLLISNIYQQGTVTAMILGILCLYYFAGIFYAIFPGKQGVSWEGHLFGLLAGFMISYM